MPSSLHNFPEIRQYFYSKRQKYLPFAINPPGDAHEFEAEKCRLSGTNSAQGTSKTKIVLSFPIKTLTVNSHAHTAGVTISERR